MRDLAGVADVEHLPVAAFVVEQADQAADHVGHVGEAARLLAVAVDRDGHPGQRLAHEVGDHHAVLPGLPRADRVEQADHHRGQLPLFPVGDGQELVDRLAAGVGPAALVGRAQHQVAVLAERELVALAVHLAGRSHQDRPLLLVRQGEHHLGEVDVGLDGANRGLDDQLHPHGGRQVKDPVAAVDQLRHHRHVGARVDDVAEALLALQVPDVVDAAGRQIIDDADLVAALQQLVGQVRSDEPRAASDEITHVLRSL